jgi:hypothetical protein
MLLDVKKHLQMLPIPTKTIAKDNCAEPNLCHRSILACGNVGL